MENAYLIPFYPYDCGTLSKLPFKHLRNKKYSCVYVCILSTFCISHLSEQCSPYFDLLIRIIILQIDSIKVI